jgi:hypothetical protein
MVVITTHRRRLLIEVTHFLSALLFPAKLNRDMGKNCLNEQLTK